MRFVDTNVLLYSLSTDESEEEKAAVARELLREADLCLSAQVLQEFYVQATHSSRPGSISVEEALSLIDSWRRYPIQETTVGLVTRAANASLRWRISYWDAAIVEAARAGGCTQLITEDLNDGQDFDGVRVVNPFKDKRSTST
ncbi:MAG: PIN domain-containing protein [Spirochaetota bacterium]